MEYSENQNTNSTNFKQENITYFYSKFDLFDESLNFYFLKYQIFKKALENSLGTDWQEYAKITIEKQGKFIDYKDVFHILLEIWLELRKEINFTPNLRSEKDEIYLNSHNKFDDECIFSQFTARFYEKIQKEEYTVEFNYSKAVIQGFYQSSKKVWRETIEGKDEENYEIDGENENTNRNGLGLGYLKNTLETFYKSKNSVIVKPLVIAKEKIFDYFTNNKKGKNLDVDSMLNLENNINENLLKNEEKNFTNFHSNVQIEASEDIKLRFEGLSLKESTASSASDQDLSRKRKFNELIQPESQKFIKIKKLTKKAEKFIDPYYLNLAAEKIGNFVQDTQKKWQVARGFVTSSIEVNYNRLTNLENNIYKNYNNLKDTVKIRFLQPAKEFYHHLMKVFLIFTTNNDQKDKKLRIQWEVFGAKSFYSFKIFRYMKPTEVFFATITQEWNKMKLENQSEETIKLFIKRVRENLLNIWEENVIKKIDFLNKKVIQP